MSHVIDQQQNQTISNDIFLLTVQQKSFVEITKLQNRNLTCNTLYSGLLFLLLIS